MNLYNYSQYKFNGGKLQNSSQKSFQGIHLSREHKLNQKAINHIGNDISNLMNIRFDKIVSLMKEATGRKAEFFRTLARKYNATTDLYSPEAKNAEQVFQLYSLVKKPNRYHHFLTMNSSASFKDLADIFSVANDRETLSFVNDFYKDVVKSRKNGAVHVINILKSDMRSDLIKNIKKYATYLKLNFDDPEAVSKLSELVKSGKFKPSLFDKKYNAKKLFKLNDLSENPNIKFSQIEENYTPEGATFISRFYNDYLHSRTNTPLQEINTANLLEMYKTTSPENLSMRLQVLYDYRFSPKVDSNGNDLIQPEIAQMLKLFDRIDKDKHLSSFMTKLMNDGHTFSSLTELNEIIDKYGSKKLNIYYQNLSRLFKDSNNEQLTSTLEKGLTDPFYETEQMYRSRINAINYGFRKQESKFSILVKKFKTKYNDLKFRFLPDSEYKPLKVNYDIMQPEIEKPVQTAMEQKPLVDVSKDIVPSEIEKPVSSQLSANKPAQIEIEPLEQTLNTNVEENSEIHLADYLKRTLSPKYKKFKIISDVNDVIGKYLKKSLIAHQQTDYAQNASKMRLSLLPDIFNSIKVTRGIARINGVSNNNVSNKDALTLYKLITGKNRKLIRYMLNKTYDNGTRIFNVKQIIALIENAESDIANYKTVDQKLFKAKDAKAYYDCLYDDLVYKYGKLPPKKRVKKAS